MIKLLSPKMTMCDTCALYEVSNVLWAWWSWQWGRMQKHCASWVQITRQWNRGSKIALLSLFGHRRPRPLDLKFSEMLNFAPAIFFTEKMATWQIKIMLYSQDPSYRLLLNRDSLKLRWHDGPAVAWLIKHLGAMGLQMVPNCDLTLKKRALKHPLGEYFGTEDKMAVIVQQNLKKSEKI